jgi:glutamyl-tRNA(Gln) amidotransferase subunit E
MMLNYNKLDLKVGLEIHQELATKQKLFCACPPKLFKNKPEFTFLRRLRPSQSELGEVDPAALFEFLKGKTIIYEANRETSCLVEMDEEPPRSLNEEALDISLTFALMTGAKPVDEVHVMRKIVIDGSNTTGFQRTCVTALGGAIVAGKKSFGLQQVALEEDAARKISEDEGKSRYRIDRLGIPLIEVATNPDIRSPKEAEDVAKRIGAILRATGKVMRGLGSIRQDINVSILGGAVIEIKGVQDLNILATVVEYEAMRQATLLEIAKELQNKFIKFSSLEETYVEVTEIFSNTRNHIIIEALKREEKVYAVILPGFTGIIGRELCPTRRLGTEMMDRAKYSAGVRGIFHTDELPAYNISENEVIALRKRMSAQKEDAIVFVAASEDKCIMALKAVVDRAREAFRGVPAETRSAKPDGTTHFTRPRPGASRMYPETDILCIPISDEKIEKLRVKLPEMPEIKLNRFMKDYNINDKLARQIIDSEYIMLFEDMAKETKVDPTLLAVTLTETFTSLERDGIEVMNLSDDIIRGTFTLTSEGRTAKESLPLIFSWLAKNPESMPFDALQALGLEMLSIEELKAIIETELANNSELIGRMGERAMGPLMGMVMKEVRGRAKAHDVQRLIKEGLKNIVSM